MQELKEQLQACGPAAPTPKHAKKAARPAAPARKRALPDADASDADEADEEEEAVGNGTAAASPVAKKVNAVCMPLNCLAPVILVQPRTCCNLDCFGLKPLVTHTRQDND